MIVSYLGRGIAHELAGTPCQDALDGRCAENGNLILALSDGAGSARWAAEAARSNVASTADFFSSLTLPEFAALTDNCGGEMLLEFCNAFLRKKQAALEEPDLRHFSATLAFAVISGEQLLMGHLGDGMALVLDDSGSVMISSGPDEGPMGGNSTWFTVSPHAAQHLRLHVLEPGQAQVGLLALVSDGMWEMLAGRGDGNPAETIRELWFYIRSGNLRNDEDLADILNQMAEVTEERMDDWSMILWCPAESGGGLPVGRVCHSMLREEEEKYGIKEHRTSQ